MSGTVYCTLFDHRYISRGLLMFDSLKKHQPEARLYVFAFDELTYELLCELKKTDLIPVSLSAFEDEALLQVKPSRTAGEYCWTSTSSTILFVLEKYQESHCTYLDADLLFYHNPAILFAEMPVTASVLITEHRYTPRYDQSQLSGRFCVQFVYFRNDAQGLEVLRWWRNACLEWCYNRHEDGKFGDQKYLDDWEQRFRGVHSLKHPGGGLAPWNIQQYLFTPTAETLLLEVKKTGQKFPVVFFHFHGVKLFEQHAILAPKHYLISRSVRRYFYNPYLMALQEENSLLSRLFPGRFKNKPGTVAAYWKEKLLKGNGSWLINNVFRALLG